MKKRFRRLLAGALTVLMCGTAQAQVELFAVNVGKGDAVSYTHLTLPTICSV